MAVCAPKYRRRSASAILYFMVGSSSSASFDRGLPWVIYRGLGWGVAQESPVTASPAVPAANRLLAAVPGKDRDHLLAQCEPIELLFAEELCRAGDLITQVYFPTGSCISLVMPIDRNAHLGLVLIGNEGMLGLTLVLEVPVAPLHAVVQGAGPAWRLTAAALLYELAQSPALQRELKRYIYVSMSQLAQTAGCTRFHVVEARLACWLLMTQDRAHADTFHVTQVSMAICWEFGASASPKQRMGYRSNSRSATTGGNSPFSTALAWKLRLSAVIARLPQPTRES